MGLRPGRTIKKIERPYCRKSIKVPKMNYVAGVPNIKLHQFEMGVKNKEFELNIYLVIKEAVQMREQSIEAARIVAQKFLETKIGLDNYFMKVLPYPHHVIREKPIATGAGADRYSRGMSLSFGKPTASAIRTTANERLFQLKINKVHLDFAKQALKKASLKLSTPSRIVIE
jgi:large subunit ribosomal protein L10e